MNCQAFDAILFHKIFLNTASEYGRIPVFSTVFSRIRTYGEIWVRENLYSGIFYVVEYVKYVKDRFSECLNKNHL